MSLDPSAASVVICAYTLDRWDGLVRAVTSVQGLSEVIVVIDHNPELLERARSELMGCRLVANEGQRGLSGARNTGLAAADREIVAFMDDDAEADPGWLMALTSAFAMDDVVGAGGTIVPAWEGGRPTWFPPAFDWVVGCTYEGYPTAVTSVRNVLGCNMAFRRQALASIGGFKTALGRLGTMPFGVEETEACIRLTAEDPSARIQYVPAAIVRHSVPRSRATWSYFRRRCFAEGVSKAILARMVGTEMALETERSYLRSVLPRAVIRSTREAVREGRPGLVLRAMAIIAGAAVTGAGYAWGRGTSRAHISPAAAGDR
jgi:cellulose synthase/poly-beta-1,6-N-acetylglucosamine synthase-like glycosyltransferase